MLDGDSEAIWREIWSDRSKWRVVSAKRVKVLLWVIRIPPALLWDQITASTAGAAAVTSLWCLGRGES